MPSIPNATISAATPPAVAEDDLHDLNEQQQTILIFWIHAFCLLASFACGSLCLALTIVAAAQLAPPALSITLFSEKMTKGLYYVLLDVYTAAVAHPWSAALVLAVVFMLVLLPVAFVIDDEPEDDCVSDCLQSLESMVFGGYETITNRGLVRGLKEKVKTLEIQKGQFLERSVDANKELKDLLQDVVSNGNQSQKAIESDLDKFDQELKKLNAQTERSRNARKADARNHEKALNAYITRHQRCFENRIEELKKKLNKKLKAERVSKFKYVELYSREVAAQEETHKRLQDEHQKLEEKLQNVIAGREQDRQTFQAGAQKQEAKLQDMVAQKLQREKTLEADAQKHEKDPESLRDQEKLDQVKSNDLAKQLEAALQVVQDRDAALQAAAENSKELEQKLQIIGEANDKIEKEAQALHAANATLESDIQNFEADKRDRETKIDELHKDLDAANLQNQRLYQVRRSRGGERVKRAKKALEKLAAEDTGKLFSPRSDLVKIFRSNTDTTFDGCITLGSSSAGFAQVRRFIPADSDCGVGASISAAASWKKMLKGLTEEKADEIVPSSEGIAPQDERGSSNEEKARKADHDILANTGDDGQKAGAVPNEAPKGPKAMQGPQGSAHAPNQDRSGSNGSQPRPRQWNPSAPGFQPPFHQQYPPAPTRPQQTPPAGYPTGPYPPLQPFRQTFYPNRPPTGPSPPYTPPPMGPQGNFPPPPLGPMQRPSPQNSRPQQQPRFVLSQMLTLETEPLTDITQTRTLLPAGTLAPVVFSQSLHSRDIQHLALGDSLGLAETTELECAVAVESASARLVDHSPSSTKSSASYKSDPAYDSEGPYESR